MKEKDKNISSKCKSKAEMKEWKKGDYASFSICLALSVLYFVDLPVNAWTFHFTHVNVFHLCTNMIALSVFSPYIKKWFTIILAYIISSLSWYIDQNAVGFSGIIFFFWGSIIIENFHTINNRKRKIIYAAGILIAFVPSLFMTSLSTSLHLIPFLSGILYSFIVSRIENYKNDLMKVRKK